MKRPIAEIRRASGVIQREAAKELGCCQSTWSRWERSERNPKQRRLSRTAMIHAVKRAAVAQGSGIQVDIEDLV